MVTTKMDAAPKRRFLLVYGSETGQAKAIAEDVADKSAANGLTADLHCADGVDKEFRLLEERLLVLVCSTTGEGESPNNASKMLRRLRNKALKDDHLSHLRYTILGLGDTNYSNFCQCPKDFHQRLQALGGQTFYAPGWADDGTGLDVVCDPWIEGLWPALQKETSTMVERSDVNGESEEPSRSSAKTTTTTTTSTALAATTVSPAAPRPSTASLRHSTAPLCDAALSVPTEAPPFLSIRWHVERGGERSSGGFEKIHNGVPFPSTTSEIFKVPVEKCWRLTTDDAVKTALDVCIRTTGTPLEHFRPGDAFAVVVQNPIQEVDLLLNRLFLGDGSESRGEPALDGGRGEGGGSVAVTAETPFTLSLLKNTTKVKAEVPPFIPENVTPRHLFESLLDIRVVPKKGFLRMLAQYCLDDEEKRRLLELSSKQGSKDYDAFIRQPCLGVVDVLLAFPSTSPPLERLIENLPRLQARSYSISSSPLRCPGRAHFVFNVVEYEMTQDSPLNKTRRGICTGMLDDVTKQTQLREAPCFDDETDGLDDLSLSDSNPPLRLSVFTRPNPWFLHPDDDLGRPLMMIGPGTGVAPFLGFLQHREKLMEDKGLSPSDAGQTWLFFGCRHQNRDFLYKTELDRLQSRGILTHFLTSFSRDAANGEGHVGPKYVQHRVAEKCHDVGEILMNPKAMVYICGDAKNMARNVNEAFIDVLVGGGMTKMEAMKHLADLREQKRYLQDVWA